MPLTDLIRYFNVADTTGESTLYLDGKRAAAWHHGLRLGSLFQPIVDLRQERILGHQAHLLAQHEDGRVITAAEAYAACETPTSVIQFDRLCRTLHALNFLAQQQVTGGYLQMAVHPRHLLAVQNQHGLVYEAILKRCGLAPEDIVLQFDTCSIGIQPRLADAVSNYRQRGYRTCLTGPLPSEALLTLKPDIVQFDSAASAKALKSAQPTDVLIELTGIDTGQTYSKANAAGLDLCQGQLFGSPEADCRPTHGKHRVAYNHPSPFGAPHENRP
jgi:EAL domain-containing protein (putative c-di-GMP-specific phosphodiesterase class I)